jgi:hypothetical protein
VAVSIHRTPGIDGFKLLQLGRKCCRFSITSHNVPCSQHRFCGDVVVTGYPYCEKHVKKSYQHLRTKPQA